jgi:periplasmic protein TonB
VQDQHIPFVGASGPAGNPGVSYGDAPSHLEQLHDVLVDILLEETSIHQKRSPFDWVASFCFHIAIVAVFIVLPLYLTTGLDPQKLNLTFLAPPPMPAAAPPPAAIASTPRPARVTPPKVITPGQIQAPTFIPKAVAPPDPEGTPPDAALMGVAGGVPGGIPGGQVGGTIGGVLGGVPKGAPPPALPVAQGPKSPIRVGGDVKPPRLLFGPPPDYPLLAKQSRLAGIVVIDAIIDENGNVKGMRVISGHPLLIQAALTAVSKRRYEPTVLDGEPTPIALRVEVSFSFS